eukprot:scaffold21207_cov198-Skeletonema_marinoi.AAC.13
MQPIKNNKIARRAGFEPARPEANGFQVHPVNHSGTVVKQVRPRIELGLLESEPNVITTYTIGPHQDSN